jgi:TMEM175 potassium channel family protein
VRRPSSTSERLEAFSDGVIAIAITLLVLELKVPDAENGQLLDALARNWPSYVAFVLSFVVIGIMWVSHHSMFERIAQVDRGLLFVNLGLLLGIAFLPFPTALLASYVRDGGSNAQIAAAIYSATMASIGLVFVGMWYYLYRRPHLLVDGIEPALLRRSIRRSWASPIVYGASIGLAFVNPLACFVVYGMMAVYFAWGPSSRILHPRANAASDVDTL